jgi:carbohydrate diacid regulator
LAKNPFGDEMVRTIDNLIVCGESANLFNTLITYLKYNGDIQKVIEALHIHRNSLQYRIKRIKDITLKDPGKYLDMLYLYSAYIMHTLKKTEYR